MEALPDDLRREIEGLECLRARDVRKKYAGLLSDIPNCQSDGILKAVVAYRLQERHYGVSLSEAVHAWLHGAEGTVGQSATPEVNVTNAQLVREWNGVRHVVSIRRDGQCNTTDGSTSPSRRSPARSRGRAGTDGSSSR